jgi:catechol-2,3-dioxygenase
MEIHHVALRTRDVEALASFYVDVVGLEATPNAGGDSVWLRAGRAVVMLERAAPGEPLPPAGAMDFLAFATTAADKRALVSRLARAQITVEAETAHTLYFRDPDGRRVGASSYPLPTRDTDAGA